MHRTLMSALLLLALSCGSLAAEDEGPLSPVAFLVGEHAGEGKNAFGTYQETQRGAWELGGTLIEVRTKSTMQGRTVFEDRRVISWDSAGKKIRMRQWTKGLLREYTAAVSKDGRVVFEETAREGARGESWSYTFVPKDGGGFDYQLHTDKGDGKKLFVSGSLSAELKDPGKGGGLGVRQFDAEIAGMKVQVHHPDGTGPYPAIVFSPGGDAKVFMFQGYRPYGRWYATWGYVTVLTAFDDADAKLRAPKYAKVLDWLVAENAREGSPLNGMVDADRLAAAGHSRGGHAALLAARGDTRIKACLALAPSGPTEAGDGGGACKTCVIVGDEDQFLETAKKAYAAARGERFLIEVAGLDHMLRQREGTLKLVARSTAFLNYALGGDARYRAPLVAALEGLTIATEPK